MALMHQRNLKAGQQN